MAREHTPGVFPIETVRKAIADGRRPARARDIAVARQQPDMAASPGCNLLVVGCGGFRPGDQEWPSRLSSNTRTIRDIRGISGLPVIGNALDIRYRRLQMLERVWAECGPIGRVRLGLTDIVIVTDGELAHDVLVTNAESFVKSRTLGQFARPLLGSGLLTSEHDLHAQQRRRMAAVFPHAKVVNWVSLMATRAEQAQASWADRKSIDAAREMMRLTLEIVTQTLFGSDISSEAMAIGDAVTEANRHIAAQASHVIPRPTWFPMPATVRNRAAIRRLDEMVYRIIEARRAESSQGSDLLSILLGMNDEADGRMTDRQIRDEVMTLIFAGHETTANALGWTWLLLSQHPEVGSMLRAELDIVLAGRTPTSTDLPSLPLALQIFKEALRLYPPVYVVGRVASRPVALAGYELPAGSTVVINVWGMHRRPDVFNEPMRFDHRRFEADRERALPRSAFLPFGAGRRVCIGNQFALVEGQVLVATLAQRVDLMAEDPLHVEPEPLMTLRQRGGMTVSVQRR